MGLNVQIDDATTTNEEGEVAADSVVAEINITPLTDVFLVLLIIFMVTSTALVESEAASRAGMKVVLPKANAAGPVSQRRSDPVLTVTRNNELYLGSRKLEASNLEAEIRKALTEVGSDVLLIRGDKNVLLGSAVDIMSVAKKAGATKIAILTAPNFGPEQVAVASRRRAPAGQKKPPARSRNPGVLRCYGEAPKGLATAN